MSRQTNKIAFTVGRPGDDFDFVIDMGTKHGFEIIRVPLSADDAPEKICGALQGFETAIVGGEPYNAQILSNLKDTKMLCRFGIGYDNIDIAAAREQNIIVANAPGGNSAAVADQAIMLMLALGRNICTFNHEVREGIWMQNRVSNQLEGKTVGIVGFGRVGRKLVEYLSGFHCRVLVQDSYISESVIQQANAIPVTLMEIAKESDYISLHLPNTPETIGMINAGFFNLTKHSAFLINTSRGTVINENDLVDALKTGKLAGAALDVFQEEPAKPNHPLMELDNVILSPHVSFNTQEANLLTASIVFENFEAYFHGHKCPYEIT